MKDIYFEANGFDMDKIREEKKIKIEKEKKDIIIFNMKTKKILVGVGLLFLIVSIGSLLISHHQSNIAGIIKNIFLIVINITSMICIVIKKKNTEMASIIGMVIIIISTFLLPMI